MLKNLILSGLELHCTLYYITVTSRYTETLKLLCFLKKKSLQYIGINLMKCGFELDCFFLDPKTAYLEALLYRNVAVVKYFGPKTALAKYLANVKFG